MINVLSSPHMLSLSTTSLLSLVLYLQFASARPTVRASNDNTPNTAVGVSANVWLPVLIVAIIFAVLIMIACIRRFTYRELGAGALASTTQDQSADQTTSSRTMRSRRPRRTPSQISTKSLPPYMKEPGDQELVIFRGPPDMNESHEPMPVLEEDDEYLETRGTQPSPPLNGLESHNTTLLDTSTTNLLYNMSGNMSMRRSVDVASVDTSGNSHESHSELLSSHVRQTSEGPQGDAPPYFEVVPQDTNDTLLNNTPVPERSIENAAPPDRRSRFSLLFNPFGGSLRHPPVSINNRAGTPYHVRSVSSLSVASTSSGHRGSPSGSGSGLLNAFRPNDHSMPIASPSTISVDSISAPLTYTLKRSEFLAPKGGLTPEQIKLITSRDALERFGAPYGPDAVAFSSSRSNMVPPPDFDATISSSPNHQNGSSPDLRDTSDTIVPSRESTGRHLPGGAAVDEVGQITTRIPSSVLQLSPSSRSPPTSSPQVESSTSSVVSFETAVSVLSRPTSPLAGRSVVQASVWPMLHQAPFV